MGVGAVRTGRERERHAVDKDQHSCMSNYYLNLSL